MNILIAGNLCLEPQTARHARGMFEILSDPAIYEFENQPPPSVEWLQERFLKLESRRSRDGREQWLNWVIRLPSGALAGFVQATVLPDFTAYVAYELASKFWRQGIGSVAVAAVIGELGVTYGIHTCVAVFKARNFRSQALLQSLAFADAPPAGVGPVACEADELVMYKRLSGGKNAV